MPVELEGTGVLTYNVDDDYDRGEDLIRRKSPIPLEIRALHDGLGTRDPAAGGHGRAVGGVEHIDGHIVIAVAGD